MSELSISFTPHYTKYNGDLAMSNGFLQIKIERHLPLIIMNRLAGMPQYFEGNIYINNELASNMRRCEVIVAALSWFTPNGGEPVIKEWCASASVCDGSNDAISGYVYSRTLFCETYDTPPEDEAVKQAVAHCLSAIKNDDLKPAVQEQRELEQKSHELLEGYPQEPTRNEYEFICKQLGIDARSDQELVVFSKSYSHYAGQYHRLDARERAIISAYRQRGLTVSREQSASDSTAVADAKLANKIVQPAMQGQLWEPCEACGEEPVYMPLHLCESCWPR